ncbi:MAG: hypothetical protein ABI461_05250 [Polyangiaceae bacterium]
MKIEVQRTVRNTCIFSAGIAVVLSPIPLADELVLFPTFGVMASRIAKHHDIATRSLPWKSILTTVGGALLARATVNLAVAALPGVSAAANATSAALLTTLLGNYIDAICTDPTAPRALTMHEILNQMKARIRAKPQPAS